MKILLSKDKVIKFTNREKNLGFVPTMGTIHKGHISLIKKSISECKKTIVTIYVNKPQFDKSHDYVKYPRNIKRDINLLKKLKIDFLYLPKTKEIYPRGQNKKINIDPFEKKLCGKYRPGHFKAIVDVVERFIKIIKPKKIFFGEKDMQQLKIIENFVYKNYRNVKIVPCKTIREKNGIALSSRNLLLSSDEKIIASKVFKILKNNKLKLIKKIIDIKFIKKEIKKLGVKKIDYVELININKIIKPFKRKLRKKIFIAYYLGKTRLIDNF